MIILVTGAGFQCRKTRATLRKIAEPHCQRSGFICRLTAGGHTGPRLLVFLLPDHVNATFRAGHAYTYRAVAVYLPVGEYIKAYVRRSHHQLSLRSYRSLKVAVGAEEVGKLRPTLRGDERPPT